MRIIIYGKENCGKCNDAKAKMKLMGFVEDKDYSYCQIDLDVFQLAWKEDNARMKQVARDAMSALQMVVGIYPVFEIDGQVFDYPAAMKRLKKWKKTNTLKTSSKISCTQEPISTTIG